MMHDIGLNPAEFRQVVRACERVMVNRFTDVSDLRCFLVSRLRDGWPETAARLQSFNDLEIAELRGDVLDALRGHPERLLWS
jgi:hypothetical protein